jgi:hypothetical protein
MTEIIEYILIITFSAVGFSMFLDNALGHPGKEYVQDIDAGAILFPWTYWLAYNRLETIKGEEFMRNLYYDLAGSAITAEDIFTAERDYKRNVVHMAGSFLTIERALGLCIFCTNFWVCVVFCAIFSICNPFTFEHFPNYILLLTVPFLSHLILKHVNRTTNH